MRRGYAVNPRQATVLPDTCMEASKIDFQAVLLALCIAIPLLSPGTAQSDPSGTPPQAAPVPDAVDLLSAFIQRVGGQAAIHSVKSMEVRGRIHLPGGRTPGTFLWLVADGGRACFRTTFSGLGTAAFGSDGSAGWSLLDLPATREVDDLTLTDVEQRRRRANWFELAFTLPERAVSMDTLGPALFEGTPAWEISIARTDGRIERLFLDRATNLLLGFTMPLDVTPGAPEIHVRFQDWRAVGELTLFHRIEISGGRTRVGLEIESVTLDAVAHSDHRFAKPSAERPHQTERHPGAERPDDA